jgi:hypothetical protein
MTKPPLMLRLAFQPVYYESARIIGYSGCLMSDFWERADKLGIPKDKLLTAVYDLTRYDKREQKPPRYELNDQSRRLCWGVLGAPPEHPLYAEREEQRRLFREESERTQHGTASRAASKKLTLEAATESLRGATPQRVLDILANPSKAIADGKDVEEQRIWAKAAEEELWRQGIEAPPQE